MGTFASFVSMAVEQEAGAACIDAASQPFIFKEHKMWIESGGKLEVLEIRQENECLYGQDDLI